MVAQKNTQIFKIEKELKRATKSISGRGPERGTERTPESPQNVIKEIKKLAPRMQDEETIITRVARESTKKYRTDRKAYIDTPDEAIVRRSARVQNQKKK